MPKKKFGPDDKFHNTIKTYPKYVISYYNNQSYVNNRQGQGRQVPNGSISLFELNVDRAVTTSSIYPFFIKNETLNSLVFKNVEGSADGGWLTSEEYNQLDPATEITSSYPLTSSISRELLIGEGSSVPYTKFEVIDGVAETGSIRKILALENTLNHNKIYSEKFDFSKYYISGAISASYSSYVEISRPHQKYTTLFCFPEIYKGQGIKPGSVELNFYITGTLLATAKDSKRNGELIETHGPRTDTVIGTVSYSAGMMLLTGNYELNPVASVTDGYLNPKITPNPELLDPDWKDRPKWVHFGAYQSYISGTGDNPAASASYGPRLSSYELKFKGTNRISTLTMFCHADKNEMNWSNNLTYVDRTYTTASNYQGLVVSQTGSSVYKEGKYIPVKNTISSSFKNYSASYSDQTFITKINIFDKDGNIIAIAKTAKPVTKKNNTDYAFKLKIDI